MQVGVSTRFGDKKSSDATNFTPAPELPAPKTDVKSKYMDPIVKKR